MKNNVAYKNYAYTLIELLIGISIISIIFSVGFASYRDFSRRQALIGVTKAIVSDLRLLQQKSLAGEKPDSCTTLSGYQMDITSSTVYNFQAVCSTGAILNYVTIKTVDLAENDVTISSTSDPIIFKILGQGTNLTSDAIITIFNSKIDKTSIVNVGIGGDVYTE